MVGRRAIEHLFDFGRNALDSLLKNLVKQAETMALGLAATALGVGPSMSFASLLPGLLLVGIGIGFAGSQLNNVILSDVPPERSGLLFVFKVFERVAYAIVLNTGEPVVVGDIVRQP